MDFFNKVGETLSNKGRDVTKKAKELAEIVALNSQISSKEDEIDRYFREIGKYIYEQHRELAGGILAEKCAAVNAAYEEIERLKAEILNAKGSVLCPECGEEIGEGVLFCPKCGAKQLEPQVKEPEEEPEEVPEPSLKQVCPGCNTELDENVAFCPVCGQKMEENKME